jgi:hypothetical protein
MSMASRTELFGFDCRNACDFTGLAILMRSQLLG